MTIIVTSENIVHSFSVSELPVTAVYITFRNLFLHRINYDKFSKEPVLSFIFFFQGFFLSTNSRGQIVT